MYKKYRYSFFSILLAIMIVLFSLFCVDHVLRTREDKLLAETGEIEVEVPVQAWQEPLDHNIDKSELISIETGHVLTMEQIENVVRLWKNDNGEIIHAPVKGQLSMEDAITIGETWLTKIGEANHLFQDAEMDSVIATLSVAKQKKSENTKLDSYYSYWTLQFSDTTLEATLYLNAVTGNIWGAEITIYNELSEKIPVESLFDFVNMAGLQTSGKEKISNDGGEAVVALKDSTLYAQLEYNKIHVDEKTIVDYSSTDTPNMDYVVLSYQLDFDE